LAPAESGGSLKILPRRANMFWNKKTNGTHGEVYNSPKDIPQILGQYLVVNLAKNADWVWRLKATTVQHGDNKDVFDFRIFDPAGVDYQKFKIKDYNSFGDHPELILFEGWYNKRTFEIHIKEMAKAA
jgi:hypothetical protein